MKDIVISNSEEMSTGVYLAKKRKSKVVHLWTGKDTVCRMYSTGGIKSAEYEIITNTLGRNICTMCSQIAIKNKLNV